MFLWKVSRHENGKATQLGTIKAYTYKQALSNAKKQFGTRSDQRFIQVARAEELA